MHAHMKNLSNYTKYAFETQVKSQVSIFRKTPFISRACEKGKKYLHFPLICGNL